MGSDDEELDRLRAHAARDEEWLGLLGNANDVAPLVQRDLDMTRWTISALSEHPSGTNRSSFDEARRHLVQSCEFADANLPMIPRIDPVMVGTAFVATSSGFLTVFDSVVSACDAGTADATRYYQKHATAFRELQKTQNRVETVGGDLTRLNDPSLSERFVKAAKDYELCRSGIMDRSTAAAQMRVVLDGLRGVLWAKARPNNPRENMTWTIMTARLGKGAPGGPEQQSLAAQESIYSGLYDRLSKVAKDYEGRHAHLSLDDVWAELLEHVHVVIGLIRL